MLVRSKFGVIFCIITLVLSVVSSVSAALEGMWFTDHPELGGIYFRVKSDGSCTYFLEKGTKTKIIHGKYEEIPTGLKLTFDNGVYFSIGELEPGYVDIRMDLSPGHDIKPGIVVEQAGLINADSIGRMTVNPGQNETDEERSGYFGAWEGELISGKRIYFFFKEDRTAGMTYSYTSPNDAVEYDQIVGYWHKDGEKLQVQWNDGSFTLVETNGRRIEQTTFLAGELLESAKGQTSRILPIKTKDLPEEWFKTFKEDYVARMPIIVMRQLPLLKRFFRGEWVIGVKSDSQEFKSIQLKRFGKAYTNRFGGMKGDWFPGSDTASIVWRNGVREQLSAVGNQFMVKSFNPDQPVSGRPARIEPVNPVDSDKMGYFLNRKKELLDPSRFMKSFKKAYEKSSRTNQNDKAEEE